MQHKTEMKKEKNGSSKRTQINNKREKKKKIKPNGMSSHLR
jgi:hypothetical protein